MTREYLFRGIREDNGEWVYGTYHYCNKEGLMRYVDWGTGDRVVTDKLTQFNSHWILVHRTPSDVGWDVRDTYQQFWVKQETVGQYTGFKDRKENPIFDGDIVRLADKYNYIVKWDEGRWVCDHTNEEWGRWGNLYRAFECDFLQKYFVIIGNIYQNPELLTK